MRRKGMYDPLLGIIAGKHQASHVSCKLPRSKTLRVKQIVHIICVASFSPAFLSCPLFRPPRFMHLLSWTHISREQRCILRYMRNAEKVQKGNSACKRIRYAGKGPQTNARTSARFTDTGIGISFREGFMQLGFPSFPQLQYRSAEVAFPAES